MTETHFKFSGLSDTDLKDDLHRFEDIDPENAI